MTFATSMDDDDGGMDEAIALMLSIAAATAEDEDTGPLTLERDPGH